MKIKWEAKDIKGGEKVTKPNISEVWMIGYTPSMSEKGNDHQMVSMSDGCVCQVHSKQAMADMLTKERYIPVEFLGRFFPDSAEGRNAKRRPAKKAYSIAAIQKEHAKAYEPWTPKEEETLKNLVKGGMAIKKIALQLGRKPGGIRSRIEKLGLK